MGDSDKNIFKKALGSRVFLFFALLVLIFLAINVGRESYRNYQINQEANRLKKESEQMEKRNNYLAGLMEYFKDESYLEEQARLKLNLKKPGENVLIIEGSREKSQTAEKKTEQKAASPTPEPEEPANYWKWWEYFFK